MAKKRVDEVDRLPRPCPPNVHENRRKIWQKYPRTVHDKKGLKAMRANPLKDGLF